MDIRQITPDFAVSPQIEPGDVPALKEAGFRTVVCNRPDVEVPHELSAEAMRAAVEAAGLTFVENPIDGSAITADGIAAQGTAADAGEGPVFAYCRSGTRSAMVWAMSQAGKREIDDILAACAQAGYPFDGLRGQLERLAES
ncbi:MAG: TIGR01244 family phosphatase [Rhodobacteraceae bacterium]|nr:TIGR01244 family phosphatase [Alphaproteobacteria bacterium]MBT8474349.1 TIGR01244 family phosphatase [Alphaproteobacteria bacterium]NNF70578.1 TIGR01244 family phosphatase [Paracoccaceae bacterium]NNK66432.1 TIGR01244 family phosphatase [Paracoccaceae bacterium]